MSCSGCSSTGAASADFARATLGDGGAFGLGTAIARGGVAVACASGVSEGFGDVFLFGLVDSKPDRPFPGVDFFFFLPLGELSFAGDFFAFGFVKASGVSRGVADASDSSLAVFFFFDFADGDSVSDFFFL